MSIQSSSSTAYADSKTAYTLDNQMLDKLHKFFHLLIHLSFRIRFIFASVSTILISLPPCGISSQIPIHASSTRLLLPPDAVAMNALLQQ